MDINQRMIVKDSGRAGSKGRSKITATRNDEQSNGSLRRWSVVEDDRNTVSSSSSSSRSDDIDQLAENFINKFYKQLKFEREESFKRQREVYIS